MPKPISEKRRQKITKFVQELVQELEEFKVKKYGGKPLNPITTVTFNRRYHNSSASFANKRYRLFFSLYYRNFQNRFLEYDHIKRDDEIGSLYNTDWRTNVATLVCHEYAHLLDMRNLPTPTHYKSYSDSDIHEIGHGCVWQYFYRVLRRSFVNGKYN